MYYMWEVIDGIIWLPEGRKIERLIKQKNLKAQRHRTLAHMVKSTGKLIIIEVYVCPLVSNILALIQITLSI